MLSLERTGTDGRKRLIGIFLGQPLSLRSAVVLTRLGGLDEDRLLALGLQVPPPGFHRLFYRGSLAVLEHCCRCGACRPEAASGDALQDGHGTIADAQHEVREVEG